MWSHSSLGAPAAPTTRWRDALPSTSADSDRLPETIPGSSAMVVAGQSLRTTSSASEVIVERINPRQFAFWQFQYGLVFSTVLAPCHRPLDAVGRIAGRLGNQEVVSWVPGFSMRCPGGAGHQVFLLDGR